MVIPEEAFVNMLYKSSVQLYNFYRRFLCMLHYCQITHIYKKLPGCACGPFASYEAADTRRAQPGSFIYTYVRSLSSYRKTPFKSRYNKKEPGHIRVGVCRPAGAKGPPDMTGSCSDLFICEGIRACQMLNCLLYRWPALSPISYQRGSQSGRSPCHRALTRPSLCLL